MVDIGLDFALGEMADAIRETTHRFASDRIVPLAPRIDEEDWFPIELWPEMGALGLHGITVAEEDGGWASAISNMSSRRRRWPARRHPSASATARIPICASTRSAAGPTRSRRPNICPS
jgi:alkylation response protein AidB-like acyl-CoA dehydrogenase